MITFERNAQAFKFLLVIHMKCSVAFSKLVIACNAITV